MSQQRFNLTDIVEASRLEPSLGNRRGDGNEVIKVELALIVGSGKHLGLIEIVRQRHTADRAGGAITVVENFQQALLLRMVHHRPSIGLPEPGTDRGSTLKHAARHSGRNASERRVR